MGPALNIAPALRSYFEALDRYDVEAAVACFTEDVYYSRPPYVHGIDSRFNRGEGLRVEVHGRDDLRQLFLDRGPKPNLRHVFLAAATEGNTAFLAGEDLEDDKRLASFLCVAVLERAGRISRYIAYSGVPPADLMREVGNTDS